MATYRHKDAEYDLGAVPNCDLAILGVLMDIRDELKAIKYVLQ